LIYNKKKTVAIIMATYNGENFIKQQIDSILSQKKVSVDFYISDDSSNDNTLNIVAAYKKKYPKKFKKIFCVRFRSPSKNFLSIIKKININYKYYAFSGQDDVWHSNKLNRAINILDKGYNLYCSRTILVNKNLEIYGYSKLFKKPPVFENAIVQCIAGGSTMVFDNKLFKILQKNCSFNVPSEDWWLYILSTFFGKKVFYDKFPTIFYRSHDNNAMGPNVSLLSMLKRLFMVLNNELKKWNNQNINALKKISKKNIPKQNIKTLNDFISLRTSYKFNDIIKLRVFRQTWFSNLMLKFFFILKKI